MLAITPRHRQFGLVGQAFSFTVTTTGVPNSIKSSRRPTGLRLPTRQRAPTISGTPNKRDVPGTYPLSITATFGKGKTATVVSQGFTLTLAAG